MLLNMASHLPQMGVLTFAPPVASTLTVHKRTSEVRGEGFSSVDKEGRIKMRTSALLVQKSDFFEIYGFCANVFYGRTLTCI